MPISPIKADRNNKTAKSRYFTIAKIEAIPAMTMQVMANNENTILTSLKPSLSSE